MVGIRLQHAFDFRKLIIGGGRIPVSEEALQKQKDAIKWLVENKLPQLNAAALQRQTSRVMEWVIDNYDSFYDREAAKLKLKGRDGVYNALHMSAGDIVNENCSSLDEFFYALEYLVVYKLSQSDTERLGSTMNLTKTKLRKHLGTRTFQRLVFLKFNLPHLHEVVDFDKYIVHWRANKKRSASSCPSHEANRGSVIRRHLGESTNTIFGGKYTGTFGDGGESDSETDDEKDAANGDAPPGSETDTDDDDEEEVETAVRRGVPKRKRAVFKKNYFVAHISLSCILLPVETGEFYVYNIYLNRNNFKT